MILAIDPDTTTTGWTALDHDGLLAVGMVRAGGFESMVRNGATAFQHVVRRWRPTLIVVEGQQIYSGSKAQHASIMTLCSTAGAIYGQLAMMVPHARLEMPLPATWKGQTPKTINQARSFEALGIPYQRGKSYCWPTLCNVEGASALRQADWEHVGDAIGLALWGRKQIESSR